MKYYLRLAPLLALLIASLQAAAHEHLAAGATGPTNGAQLIFFNASDYSSDSGYVFNFGAGTPADAYDGFYYTADLVFVALAATPNLGGPEPGHAALGTHIEVVLETVEGPNNGATFGFWETPTPDVDSTNLTWSVPVGLVNGTNHIFVSENDGSASADPYGHLHGRVYSFTQPGLYKTGWRFVDTSTNGPGGGPIDTPSDRFYLYMQAGVTIASISVDTNGVNLTFGAPSNLPDTGSAPATNYTIEASSSLGLDANWSQVGDVIVGDDHLHTVTVPLNGTIEFYRLTTD
jgi:hypothetical protein